MSYPTAEQLTAQGYQRISNRHRMAARLDRPDWIEVLAKGLMRAPADFYIRGGHLNGQPSTSWAEHYLRCYSKDVLHDIPAKVFRALPGAGTHAHYCEKES